MKRLLLCSLLALPLFAGDPKLADLAWMSGHWSATIDGTEMEEVWLAPKGDVMTGMHRDVRANGKTFFEFLRIAQTSDGIVYLAQPKGQPPTPFKLVESSQTALSSPIPSTTFRNASSTPFATDVSARGWKGRRTARTSMRSGAGREETERYSGSVPPPNS